MDFLLTKLRQGLRLISVLGVFVISGFDFLIRVPRNPSLRDRAEWLKRSAKRMCRAVHFEVKVHGEVPSGGFIAPNHLGYMDIVVLASVAPQVFLSKSEVDKWPVVGLYTRMAGTLYINRKRRSDVARKESAFAEVIEAGLNMTFFLEGTSTDGATVLPFRASLLQPLIANQWPVTPAFLRFEATGGDVRQDVCWWGDMGFASHLIRMLGVKKVDTTIVFGERRLPGEDRKVLASELYKDVVALSDSLVDLRPRP